MRLARSSPFTASLCLALTLAATTFPFALDAQAAPATPAARPKVLLVATGGTIAGVQNAPGTLGGYRAGALTAEQVIASVPELARFAEVETEQFSNVASTAITPAQWVGLSKRINKVLAERSDLAGVVVTHGTDRLEETAFFLYLTIKSDKPVVVVGAQRPATGISPDGPINLLAAVRTVVSPQAAGKGVMVVMDDRILSAREVRKLYQRTGGFDTGEMGMLGVVSGGGVEFFFTPARRHGSATEFDVATIDSLPTVELTFSYPGGKGQQFNPKPAGVVVATTGFTRDESVTYRNLRASGVVLVTAFPSGDNVNSFGGGPPAAPVAAIAPTRPDSARAMTAADSAAQAERNAPPAVVAQHLTPQKARILLMLALTRTRDPREIQRYFVAY
jgi:L-asparaginase type II